MIYLFIFIFILCVTVLFYFHPDYFPGGNIAFFKIFNEMRNVEFLQSKDFGKFDQKLIKLVFKTAGAIIESANKDNKEVVSIKIGDSIWFEMIIEILYIYLYMIGRFRLNDEERWRTFNHNLTELSINTVVEAVCNNWGSEMIEKIKKECWDNYFKAMEDYSKRGNKGGIDNLFSMAFIRDTIAKDLPDNKKNNSGFLIGCNLILATSFKELDVKRFIKKIK